MSYRDMSKRLAALEADVLPADEPLTIDARIAASWGECARLLDLYLSRRRGYRLLADEGRKAWAWMQERHQQNYSYRDDDMALRLVQHAEVIQYDPDADYIVPVLQMLPEARHYLMVDGRVTV